MIVMSYSRLATYVNISPHRYSPRSHVIDTISIHCMAGDLSLETCADIFQRDREASSNYGIDSDGKIGVFVDEFDASMCTSSYSNDNRAITIEVANNGGGPIWPVSAKAYESLILLLVDICDRHDIDSLKWEADKSLIGQVDKQNMTVHRWFANKACPGEYLYAHHYDIARRVNEKLKEDNMDGKEIYERLMTYLTSLPTSDYAEESSRKAIESGIFKDGNSDKLVDNPRAPLTREQLAVVLNRLGLLDKQ